MVPLASGPSSDAGGCCGTHRPHSPSRVGPTKDGETCPISLRRSTLNLRPIIWTSWCWCFHDTYGIEQKISEHAEALGLPAPLKRPSKPAHETAEELQIWLKMHDPLTDTRHERLISTIFFAPPPAAKGTVLETVYRPLDEREQAEFRQFVDRLKREMLRRGAHPKPSPAAAYAPAPPPQEF